MWFKLSLLLFLIFCSCNVSSKNLRKSLNQKVDGYGFMEVSFSPNAAQDGVKGGKGVPEKEYGFGDEAKEKQHHGTMDDSSNLNNDDVYQNKREFDSSNFESDDKQVNDESNDNKFGEKKHGRFRRSSDGNSVGGFILWLLIVGGIVLCCCLPGIILCVILMRRPNG
uniref:Transmembrane protein n=1 Tax=Panagrolaimus davidi TaxID=227884 RepID=A0A914RB70_9BILA